MADCRWQRTRVIIQAPMFPFSASSTAILPPPPSLPWSSLARPNSTCSSRVLMETSERQVLGRDPSPCCLSITEAATEVSTRIDYKVPKYLPTCRYLGRYIRYDFAVKALNNFNFRDRHNVRHSPYLQRSYFESSQLLQWIYCTSKVFWNCHQLSQHTRLLI